MPYRLFCRMCLRFWSSDSAGHRSACPHCGGALEIR